MKVSLSWLNEYVPVDMEVYPLAERLTMAGLEVESVTDRYESLNTVVVGRIAEISAHPNADKLKLCHVDLGDRHVQVVCGAPNVDINALAPVALPGTRLADGSILQPGNIRGQVSEGMICSEAELGLGVDSSGIMILKAPLSPGSLLAEALALSDPVLEFDLTPNRSDCLSILGLAREVAAIQKTTVKYPQITLPSAYDEISAYTSVIIEAPEHCPRYAARLLENITVDVSPFWLQDRLLSIGLRPINNIVDVTNFVMMETGQPLHAFDFDNLAENRIVVRLAYEGESFTTLDQKDRILSHDTLMICDGQKPVAVGGVMGGLNSEIAEKTTRVLIESAYFSPPGIRKTSKRLGLKTDASHRFERGVDPDGTVRALNRAAQMMAEIGNGKLIDGIIDEHPGTIPQKKISLGAAETNRLLGTDLDIAAIADMLTSIEFTVANDRKDHITVIPPTFRVDIERPVDLIEEVARLSGYDNIPTTFPLIPAEAKPPSKQLNLRDRIRRLMTGFGFTEVINYSFISKLSCDRLRLPSDDPRRNQLDLLNPLSEDQAVMRTSLLPGIFNSMHRNLSRQVRNLKIFEVGKIFISRGQEHLPEETEMLAGLWTGTKMEPSWNFKEIDCDFFDLKGVLGALLKALDIQETRFTMMPDQSCIYTKPGHTARIFAGQTRVGLLGEALTRVLDNYEIKQQAFIFEINVDVLAPLVPHEKYAVPLPKYPAIPRDVTIIIDKGIESGNILQRVQSMEEALVEEIQLFDVYDGDPIPPGKKSISFRIVYRSAQLTLEDETVNHLHKDITGRLVEEFDADLPG
ncbi:phenylalanine--tRNA ligase subunit beta [Thermodesulfobacteriota bacterium]